MEKCIFVQFILFVLVKNIVSQEEILEYEAVKPIYELDKECLEVTKVSVDDIALIQGLQLPVSREGKCLLACMYKKIEILTPEGHYSHKGDLAAASLVLSFHPEAMQKATKIVEICALKVENIEDDEEGCEVAVALFSCVASQGDEFDSESSEEHEEP